MIFSKEKVRIIRKCENTSFFGKEMEMEYTTGALMKRFLPYFKNHKKVLITDLFCAALTTICELVLPMIIRHITDTGLNDIASLTAALIG